MATNPACQTAAPSVRLYQPDADLDDVLHVFRETCDASLRAEPLETIASYLWCRPYLHLAPSTCLVLDDGNGRAVGYILGTSDTPAFAHAWESHFRPLARRDLDGILSQAQARPRSETLDLKTESLIQDLDRPHAALYSDYFDLLRPWPGHLHINILPSHQRRGHGTRLLEAFAHAVRAEGCAGLYLGMVASNLAAARFYETAGFRRLPHVLDHGLSGDLGRTPTRPDGGATAYYVLDL